MSSIRFMIFAGLPATIQLEGTSPITTEPAPIITLEPMVMLPIIQTLAPIWTLFPMQGAFSPFIHPIFLEPMVVFCLILTLFPMIVLGWITVPLHCEKLTNYFLL